MRGNSKNGHDSKGEEKGKGVEEEELEEALEKKDDLDGLLAGGASSQKRLRKGSASDSSDMEGEESNGSEEGQLRWTHMSVRRMLQEVKKRANTSGTAVPLHFRLSPASLSFIPCSG